MPSTRTKIVATAGPACESPALVRQMIDAGADVFRLNFSHGDHASHARSIRTVRTVAAEAGVPVAVMQDLQGPRIRTGTLRDHKPVELAAGAAVALRAGDFMGDADTLSVSYEALAADVEPGESILLADGLIELTVLETDGTTVRCRVDVGGELGEHKGINLPGASLSITAPTPKDLEDLRFGLEQEVDYVALSFVRSAADVLRLKEEMLRIGGPGARTPVIAKIEKPEAVENLAEILRASDGVMVARGDLGIEMPAESVPTVQKRIIHMANHFGLPVITATQMLESMMHARRPTRAEASDVANAMLDGTDAVMLSGETAVGAYPVEAVRMMARISHKIDEVWRSEPGSVAPTIREVDNPQQHALAEAACGIADKLDAAGIVAFTMTGSTARYIAQRRPDAPVYALTPDESTYRRLALVWGVQAVMLGVFETTDEMVQQGQKRLLDLGLAAPGDVVVYMAGASTRTSGGTDMLKIHRFA